jgi:hypothetical protein
MNLFRILTYHMSIDVFRFRYYFSSVNILLFDIWTSISLRIQRIIFAQFANTFYRRNAVNRNNQDTKNEKPTVLYGTGKAAPKSSTILGALRRKWLYVGRIIGNEVSENDVKDYLQNIDCHDEIIIKKLTTKGHNSAFSIGVPPKIFNDVFNPDIWPDSVCLREFNVRSFLEKKRHIQNNM